ncbi:MAG: ABC transporter permease [Gammaproteobacteria bacterium]|nr:ABC transporter permease [Gammaproteobacteria bacterium]
MNTSFGWLTPVSIRLAALNLLRNKRRSSLSVLIIGIAVLALVSAGGFGLFTYDSLTESTSRDVGHLIMTQPGYFTAQEATPLANGLNISPAQIEQLKQHTEIRGSFARVYFSGLLANGAKSTIFTGMGVEAREFDIKGPFLNVLQGHTLSDEQSSRYNPDEPQVMLARDLAANMQVAVGDWITLLATTSEGTLNAYDFKVVGIYATGVPELDKRQLYVHLANGQELLMSSKVSSVTLFLYDTETTDAVKTKLEQQLTSLDWAQPVSLTPWYKRAFFYAKVKSLYDRIFIIMGTIMALVVFVALFNTMTMSVTERTRETGTLLALGNYPGEIVAMFMREAGLLALVGSFIGALGAGLLSLTLFLVDVQMPPPPGRTEGYPLHIYFSFELSAYVCLVILLVCLLVAYLAAKKGVKKPIIESLAYV